MSAMHHPGLQRVALACLCLSAVYGYSVAQSFPARPVRIVASDVGGGNDFAARLIAQGLTAGLGQQVIVDNRGGIVGSQTVAKATPDGHTLLLQGSAMWLLPFMRDGVPWDPERDFAPITIATSSPNVIVVHPSVPVQSVKDLIALAKAKPGGINYAVGGLGSTPHLAVELFRSMAGIDMVLVNYKGGGAAFNDLIAGQVQLMIPTAGAASAHIRSGRLKALAVTTAQPSALTPGLPTVAAAVPGYEAVSSFGVFAPAGTPPAVINRLNAEIARVLGRPDVKERFLNAGVETIGSSPQQLAAVVKSEMTRLGKLIRDSGIRAQ